MNRNPEYNRGLYSAATILLIALIALFGSGCAAVGTPELTSRIAALSPQVRDNLHVYIINSPLDQLYLGRAGDVASYLRKAGIEHSSYRHWASGSSLARDLLELRQVQPSARIALVGWSGGSLTVWDAATELNEHNQVVDCVIYLDSNWIKKRVTERGYPDNVIRTVLIYRRNNDPPDGIPAPRVYRVDTSNHMAIPTHPQAVEAMVQELIATATQPRV